MGTEGDLPSNDDKSRHNVPLYLENADPHRPQLPDWAQETGGDDHDEWKWECTLDTAIKKIFKTNTDQQTSSFSTLFKLS